MAGIGQGRAAGGPPAGGGFWITTTVGLRCGCSSSLVADSLGLRLPAPVAPRPARLANAIPLSRPVGAMPPMSGPAGALSPPALGSDSTANLISGAAMAQLCGTDRAPTNAACPTNAEVGTMLGADTNTSASGRSVPRVLPCVGATPPPFGWAWSLLVL